MEELKKALEDLGRAFEEFKSANDQRIKQLETKGHADPTLETKVQKANADIERLTGVRDELQKRIDSIETKMQRPNLDTKDGRGIVRTSEEVEHKRALVGYLRRGHDSGLTDLEVKSMAAYLQRKGLSEMEVKALSVSSDPSGGYLVAPEMSDRVIEKVFESSPIRQIAAVETIGSDALEMRDDLGEASSGWVAESGARAKTATPTVGLRRIPVHELYAYPEATQKMLDDAAFNVEEWLDRKVSEKFTRDEATAFVNGNGVGKPRGFLTYPAGTTNPGQIEQINGGHASLLQADGLIKLFYGIKDLYAANGTWLMKRSTVQEVRLLKDTTNQYLWQPGLAGGQPDTLLTRPIVKADDMPAVAANALAVAFGDFRAAYQIVDRVGIRVLRDPFTNKPFVGFYTTKRVGGDVANFEAIKIQKIAA